MSGQFPPVSCREFKRVLKALDFEAAPSGATSHEQWKGNYGGQRRLVTVDCPKAPFSEPLLGFMLKQIGISKKDFYKLLAKL